jgi:hypothetical protein
MAAVQMPETREREDMHEVQGMFMGRASSPLHADHAAAGWW